MTQTFGFPRVNMGGCVGFILTLDVGFDLQKPILAELGYANVGVLSVVYGH